MRADLVKVVFKETVNEQSGRNIDQLLTLQANHLTSSVERWKRQFRSWLEPRE